MKHFTLALSLVAVLALAACSSNSTMWGENAPAKAADKAFSKASHK
jgi:hypothetical protein